MTDTERARGRPRRFDLDQALTTAQGLFHDKGYDAVGVAALTSAIGINPPSFYAAFGSKAALFERVLDRYMTRGLRLESVMAPGDTPADTLRAYLTAAAHIYAACPQEAGCLIFEAARGSDGAESTTAARRRKETCREHIRIFLNQTHPAAARTVADAVIAVMSGLSAGAREGWGEARLVAVVDVAAAGFAHALS